jgi:hypothetical protein
MKTPIALCALLAGVPLIPRAEYRMSHFLMMELPAKFNAALIAFLGTHKLLL